MINPTPLIVFYWTVLTPLHAINDFTFLVQTGHPFGFDNSIKWCADGFLGALTKTLETYKAADISINQLEEFARAYHTHGRRLQEYALDVGPDWIDNPTATLIQLPDDSRNVSADMRGLAKRRPPLRTREKPTREVIEAQRALAKAASPLGPILPLLPLLRDVLMPTSPEGNKVESLMANVCALFDLEAESSKLEELVPITCGVLDIIYSAVLCGDMKEQVAEAESCREYQESTHKSPLADESCKSSPESLMGDIQFNWNDDHLLLDLPLIDLTGVTPRYIPEDIRQAELLTYLVLFRAVQHASTQARYCLHNEKLRLPDLIPGWPTERVFVVQQKAAKGHAGGVTTPLSFLSVREGKGCDMAIGVRGSLTQQDWFHSMALSQSVHGLLNETHSGLAHLTEGLLPAVLRTIEEVSADNECTCESLKLTFYGHSLGAAVAQLLALGAAAKYKRFECTLRVDAVLFAPLKILSVHQQALYGDVVNSRTIADVKDPLTHLPCNDNNSRNGHPRCSAFKAETASIMTHASSSPGQGRDAYADNYGQILLDVIYPNNDETSFILAPLQKTYPFLMTVLNSALAPSTLAALPSPQSIRRAHSCAPACALSAACLREDFGTRWWCEDCEI